MGLKIPHMGWNRVFYSKQTPLFRGIRDGSFFYFVHSFYVVPDDASETAGEAEYGIRFSCAVSRDSVFAVQFHPEKSQKIGLRVLENFASL
jgi:glutamine amidotransferase